MSLTFEPDVTKDELTRSTSDSEPILIVEDSEDIRALLNELLEDTGQQLVFAVNGEDGLTAAQSYQPRLILMDLSLPGMDGWETVRQLRRMPAFEQTPILALTAHATDRDRQRAIEAGCSDYISKPFDADELLEKIAKFLQ